MKAFGIKSQGDVDVLEEIEIPKPKITSPTDILVQVKAVSVNPVDFKVRSNKIDFKVSASPSAPLILGYDASGIVVEAGTEASKRFKVGDEVAYAGDINRQGSNAEFQVVDSRIVGKKPKSLGWAQTASYPLTTLTAWEGLFEQLEIDVEGKRDAGKPLLVIGGAGGVGSIVIQFAKRLANLSVIATASRPETTTFCKDLGADFIISHREPLLPQLEKLGFKNVDYVFNTQNVDDYWDQVAEVLVPIGKVVYIIDAKKLHSPNQYFFKRLTAAFEMMFTRSSHNIEPERQGHILDKMAELIDEGKVKSTQTKILKLNLENLREAHRMLESSKMVGKVALEW